MSVPPKFIHNKKHVLTVSHVLVIVRIYHDSILSVVFVSGLQ